MNVRHLACHVPLLTVLGLTGATSAQAAAPGAQCVTNQALMMGTAEWHPASLLSGGASNITSEQRDALGGAGSLAQVLPFPGDPSYSATVLMYSPDTERDPAFGLQPSMRGFGLLRDLNRVEFQWYRDSSSTTFAWLGSAFRLVLYDPNQGARGSVWLMVWEPLYNGYATGPGTSLPTNRWITSEISKDFFWRTPVFFDGVRTPRNYCTLFPSDCYMYDRGLSDWGFSSDTVVMGMMISAGSGWPGSYKGFVDGVRLEFAGSAPLFWDFEPN